jgi:NifU-like protein involved in Fe-S cluster formation
LDKRQHEDISDQHLKEGHKAVVEDLEAMQQVQDAPATLKCLALGGIYGLHPEI